jgi:hypothetical protein
MWSLIFKYFPYEDNNISRNAVSFSHSLLTSALIGFNFKHEIITLCSGSYFIWDLLHMLENRIQYGYMYHHLVTLLFLFSNYSPIFIHKLLLNAEISNFPGYIVYHKLKIKKKCNFEKVIQLLFYFYFRIYKFSTFVFKYYENNFIMNNLLVIYFLGQVWFVKQARKICW